MSNKIKKQSSLIVVSALVITIVGTFFWLNPKYNQASSFKASENRAAEVAVTIVQKQNVELFQDLPARVNGFKISEVRPQVGGVIKEIKFSEGSFVKKGQQLYQIDPVMYQSTWQSAQKNLKALRAKRDRYKILLEQDAVSKQEFDDIEASFAQADSDAQKAKANFSYSKVLAPISGYIGKSNLTEGALVDANQTNPLVTIVQLDPIYVDMVQTTKDALEIKDHNQIKVTIADENSSEIAEGKLKMIESFADESTDSVRLRALFENKNKKLIPGMFVKAKLHLKPIEVILVPQRATMRTPDGNLMVFVVQGDVAKMRPIKAERIFEDSWIVDSGLEDGEVLIVEGYQKIADGAKVNTVTFNAEVQK